MKKPFLVILFIAFIFLLISLIYYYLHLQEDRLEKKAELIKEGMQEEEVINIMGQPKHIDKISSGEIPMGWIYEWQQKYETMRKSYDSLIMHAYYVKAYSLKTFRGRNPGLIIGVYFHPVSKTVVYV